MHGLNAPEILEIWENGEGRPQWHRALLLAVRAARPLAVDAVAQLEVGERDRLILALRQKTLGCPLQAVTRCPGCGETVEFTLPAEDLADPPRSAAVYEWAHGTFRLPNTEDVAAARSPEDLFQRCAGGAPLDALPEWEQEIERRDPRADLVVNLECATCRRQWEIPFDATRFFWRELRAAAHRLLRDVAALASRYGWTEEEVLKLSPRRRRMYLELDRGEGL
jgi:hypothetical protein